MMSSIAARVLAIYFDGYERNLQPHDRPEGGVRVDEKTLAVWYGDTPAELRSPEDFITAWTLVDMVLECFSGEPSALGRKTVDSLSESGTIDCDHGWYNRLRDKLCHVIPGLVRDVAFQIYDDARDAADHMAR